MHVDLQLKLDIFQQTWALIETYEMLSVGPMFCFFAIACDNLYLYLCICLFFSVNISSKCYVYIVMFLTSLIKTQLKKKRGCM